jgi:type II secretory pathway component GspD/PulD (secretin)
MFCSGSSVSLGANPPGSAKELPTVLSVSVISANRAAKVLRGIYRRDIINVDEGANALVVIAPPDDIVGMRNVLTGIDVKSPFENEVDAIPLHMADPKKLIDELAPLFSNARFRVGPNHTVLVVAASPVIGQIRTVANALDAPPPAPSPLPLEAPTIVHLKQGDPRSISRALAHSFPNLSVRISGSNLVLRGPADVVGMAATASGQLDQPPPGLQFTEVYRLSSVDARSVAGLLSRSFPGIDVQVDHDLNALTILADAKVQQRVSDAITQLDTISQGNHEATSGQQSGGGGFDTEVVYLHAAVPGANGGPSTSATDIATTVLQSIGQSNPDLKMTVPPNSTKIILTGSAHSIESAKDLIAKLDVAEPLVELDTQVLEVDESVQKQLGFKFPTPVLSTTYSEVTPDTSSGGTAQQLLRLQPLTRTPLSLAAELDFLVSTSKARILEDPRITTFSGRTASLRAGETVNILTTAGGGTGTVATTQIQSFQTGVTLDITPVVNADDYVTVTLHPSVNSEAGVSSAGVPNIQTRDTTTTIGLHDGETIVVGGLIEDEDTKTVQKVPLLGDLPLIGKLFQDSSVSHTRNELIVTVTPHILRNDLQAAASGMSAVGVASAEPLPTLNPSATIPPTRITPVAGPSGYSLSQIAAQSTPTPTPTPSPTGSLNSAPSAFAKTNTYVYGAAPANNFAPSGQPPQIFFVQASPTVVKAGQMITVSAITTTNVSTLGIGSSTGSSQQSLAQTSPGKWQGSILIDPATLQSSSGNVSELLTATTALGASTSMRIPLTLAP